jgi:hypothetical protein
VVIPSARIAPLPNTSSLKALCNEASQAQPPENVRYRFLRALRNRTLTVANMYGRLLPQNRFPTAVGTGKMLGFRDSNGDMHGLSDAKPPAPKVKTAMLLLLVAVSLPLGPYCFESDGKLSYTHMRPLRRPPLRCVKIDVFCRLTIGCLLLLFLDHEFQVPRRKVHDREC